MKIKKGEEFSTQVNLFTVYLLNNDVCLDIKQENTAA